MRWALVIGVLVALPATATDSRREVAENLVHAMRADEQVAQLVERYVRDACRDGSCMVDLTKCLGAIDRNRVMDRLVTIARRELTSSEMEAATVYFRSDVGMRHSEVMKTSRGLSKASLNEQSPEVRAAMLAFLDTSAGYRLVTRSILTNSTEVNRIIQIEKGAVLDQCRPA